MKHVLTFLLFLYGYMLCGAQATSITIDNQTPGWLSSKIGYGDQQSIEDLTIIGYLNAEDLKFIGTLINNHNLHGHLNIEGCQIVDKNGTLTNTLESNCFAISYSAVNSVIEKISLPINLTSASSCFNPYITIGTLVVGGPNMKVLGKNFFSNVRGSNGNIKHLIVRDGVEEIEQYAFYHSNNYSRNYDSALASDVIQQEMPILESIQFPNSIKIIGKGAFDWCINLKQINLPNTIERIGNFAFSMTGFQPDTLNLPESLTQYNTTSFTIKNTQTVIIPASVTKIDNTYQTYYNMTNTWTTHDYISSSNNYIWVMNSLTPPSMTYYYEGFLKSSTIYVPKGTYSNYASKRPFSLAKIIEVIPIEEISFNNETLSIFVDETSNLKPIITPSNATNRGLIWTSSNPEIATVDAKGNIHGLRYGQSVINVTTLDGQKSASYDLNVYEHITSISLPSSLCINISEKKQIVPEILPIGENDGKVFWKSSNQDIASVDEDGNVKGISKGTCTITVTTLDRGFSAICNVSVVQPVESLTVSPKSLSINVGDSHQIEVNILPTNANDKSVKWMSSDESIATVNIEGKIEGVNPGSVRITAASNYNYEINDVCIVTVIQPATGISLNQSEVEIPEDESIKLIATVLPENASNKSVNWTSSDISIAMVSTDGTVYAIKPGQATIMATTVDGGFVALCKVTIKPKTIYISDIKLSTNSETLAVGETLQLNAIISPENASNKIVNWTSTNPSIANVTTTGLVTAIAEGETQIIATTSDGSNLSAICKINVNKRFITISQIQITPSSVRIPVGNTINLNVIIAPNDATNKTVKWSSTNPSVVTISEDGVVSAISDGDAIVIASTQDGSNLSATCQVECFTDYTLVESINLVSTTYVKIYSLSGYLIYEGVYSGANLSRGFYIVICNGTSYKIKVD